MLGCDDDHHIPFLIMSNSEDYLDNLLKDLGDGDLGDLDDEEFLNQFDSSILEEFKDASQTDAFLQELESELTGHIGPAPMRLATKIPQKKTSPRPITNPGRNNRRSRFLRKSSRTGILLRRGWIRCWLRKRPD